MMMGYTVEILPPFQQRTRVSSPSRHLLGTQTCPDFLAVSTNTPLLHATVTSHLSVKLIAEDHFRQASTFGTAPVPLPRL